jgi:hypothetical protein
MLRALCEQDDTYMKNRLKCNRGTPCDTCVKRKKQSSCEYANNANRNKPKNSNTRDRLQNLENSVLQLLQSGVTGKLKEQQMGAPSGTTDPLPAGSTVITPTVEQGTLHIQGGQMNYVDSSHWLSILRDIQESRERLSLSDIQDEEDRSTDGIAPSPEVDLVLGQVQPLEVCEIIRSLPPRPVCDSLISQYFNSQYMIIRKIAHSYRRLLYLSRTSNLTSAQIPERI